LTSAGCQTPNQLLSHPPLLNRTGGQIRWKSSSIEIKTEDWLTNLCHQQTGKNEFNLLLIKVDLHNEKKWQIITTSCPHPLPSSQAQLQSFIPDCSTSSLQKSQKVEEWSVQSSFSLPLLPPHAFPLLQLGLSTSHSSFRVYLPAPACGPPQAAVWIPSPLCSSSWAAETYLFLRSLTTGYSEISASPWSSASAAGESLLWHPEQPPHPPSSLTLMFTEFFLSRFFLNSYFCRAFWPLLSAFSQRHHHLGWWIQLCPELGLVWSQLELSCPIQGSPWTLLTAATPAVPCDQPLSTYTPYKCPKWTKYKVFWCFFCGTISHGHAYDHSIYVLFLYSCFTPICNYWGFSYS